MIYDNIVIKNYRKHSKTLSTLEKELDELGKIYFIKEGYCYGGLSSNYTIIKEDEIRSDKNNFLNNILDFTNNHGTVLFKDGVKVATCNPNAYRSIIDLYLLSKTYFPDTTLKEVYNALLSNPIYLFNHCRYIDRVVYYEDEEYYSDLESDNYDGEYGDNFTHTINLMDELGTRVEKIFHINSEDDCNRICERVEYKLI